MKRTITALFICLFITGAGYAADPDVEIRLDISQQDKPFTLKVHQADTPLVRARLYNNGVKWTASDLNWSGQFGYGTNYENSASLVTVQGGTAATNDNYIDFQFTATDVNTNGIFFAQMLMTNSATSRRYTFGDGRITIKKNPIGGSANPLVLVNMPTATVNGTIAYYSTNVSPNAWVILAPSTPGLYLQTRGTSSIPIWTEAVGTGVIASVDVSGGWLTDDGDTVVTIGLTTSTVSTKILEIWSELDIDKDDATGQTNIPAAGLVGDIPGARMTANAPVSTDFTQDGDFLVGTGSGTFAAENGATARASMGVSIGSQVQAYSAELDLLANKDAKNQTNMSGGAIASGTVADARIASTIARDSEVASAITIATNDNFIAATNAAMAYTDEQILLQMALDGVRPLTGNGDAGGNAWTNVKAIVLDGTVIGVYAATDNDTFGIQAHFAGPGILFKGTNHAESSEVQFVMNNGVRRMVFDGDDGNFDFRGSAVSNFPAAGITGSLANATLPAGNIPPGGTFLASDAGALTNLPSDVAFHIERPTNAIYNIKWLYCTPVNMVLTRLMGKTEAGLVQGHVIESATNSWNTYTTNLAGFSIGAGGVASTEYTSFADATVEQWKWVGIQITNDTSSTTNFSGTIHAIR